MGPLFDVTILSPAGKIYQGKARSLSVRTCEGSFEILSHHVATVAVLQPGVVKICDDAGKILKFENTATGFLKFMDNAATILF